MGLAPTVCRTIHRYGFCNKFIAEVQYKSNLYGSTKQDVTRDNIQKFGYARGVSALFITAFSIEVGEYLPLQGFLCLWLPPYSPDFNPAKNAFSNKEHNEIMQVLISDPIPVIKAAQKTVLAGLDTVK